VAAFARATAHPPALEPKAASGACRLRRQCSRAGLEAIDQMKYVSCLLAAIVVSTACGGAAPGSSASGPASAAAAGPAGAAAPTSLGSHHHAIATTNSEAQRLFDQGFTLVFAFNHEAAIASFERAAELDPHAAMPFWGIAWAAGPNYNADMDDPRATQAFAAIEKAKALAATGPALEREYIDAMAVRYSADLKADRAALAHRYSQAMGELSRRHPDDLDAATLYAESLMNLRPWQLWTLDGRPVEGTERIVTVLESVLARAPDHIGANHYYIHTVEASNSPQRALPSARRLETLAPGAGHLVHMPAHIYARTGDHAAAARANLAGAEADRVYMKTAPPDSFYAMAYYSHNLHFLADSHMMQGRLADARTAADELAARLAPHADMMPMVESMAVMPVSVLLRFGRDDEVLTLVQPAADRPVMTAWWHFARAQALARGGKIAQATAERAALVQTTALVPATALFGGTGLESAKTVLTLATTVTDARLAWARGARQDAIRTWTAAVAAADRLPYDEPPVWFYPMRESLGAALLLAGQPVEAERVFRDDLDRHPRNPRSLFGLGESLAQQGKDADAALVQQLFDEVWKNADVRLSLECF
jgi:tetratricopeptide (TPR) repeat protein